MVRRESLDNIINLSVNQTLSRTVLTSGLTLLTALALFLFGGEVLNGFSFALVVGIIVGTYSSVFIASPILVFWQNFRGTGKARRGRLPAPRVSRLASGRPCEGSARCRLGNRRILEMFDQTFVDGVGKTNKSWTVTLSFTIQFVVVGVWSSFPLILYRCAAESAVDQFAEAPAPPPPPPPPPPPHARVRSSRFRRASSTPAS